MPKKPKRDDGKLPVSAVRLAALNRHLDAYAAHAIGAAMEGVEAGLELLAIQAELAVATRPAPPKKNKKPTLNKDGTQKMVKWVGLFKRFLLSPENRAGRSVSFDLMNLAKRWTGAKAIPGTCAGGQHTCGINPAACDKARLGVLLIETGKLSIRAAKAALPDVRLLVPLPSPADAAAAQLTAEGTASEKAAQRARYVEIESILATTPLALRQQDMRQIAGEPEYEAVALEIRDGVYGTGWTAEQCPDLATAKAVALLEPAIRERIRQTNLASRKRDLAELATHIDTPSYIDELVAIVESGAADTLRGAQDVRGSASYQSSSDRHGTWIPPRLRWWLATGPDIVRSCESHARALKAAIKRGIVRMEEAHTASQVTARELGHDVGRVFSAGQLDTIQALLNQLADLQHDGLCPQCKAETESCALCSGVGWVSRARRGAWDKGKEARGEVEGG